MMTLDLIVRTSALLVAAWIASRVLNRASAATRHLLWHIAMVALLAGPVVFATVPKVPLVPAVPGMLRMAPVPIQNAAGLHSEVRRTPDTPGIPGTLGTLGTLGALAFVAFSHFGAALLSRRARRAPRAWQVEADRLRRRMGLKRHVEIRMQPGGAMPVAIGLFRSSILLPERAAEWSDERRTSVLLHELAHVQRGDCLSQALAQVACAIYWFNPLVWLAAQQLRRERERACDDQVLLAGVQPSAYATHLLDLAQGVHAAAPCGAVAMARPTEIEGRVLAVLAWKSGRTTVRTMRWAIATFVIAITLSVFGVTTATAVSPARADGAVHPPRRATPSLLSLVSSLPNGEENIAPLISALEDPSTDVREKAALGLALASSPEVIDPLLTALKDDSSQVREKAALGLAFRRDSRVVEPLITALTDRNAQVREKAAIALGSSGDRRATDALEQAVADPDSQVREKAVAALMLLNTSGPPMDGTEARTNLRRIIGSVLTLAQ